MSTRRLRLVLLLLLAGPSLLAAEPQMVATPRATLLPVSTSNRPFLSADRAVQPVDLAARGYVESELLVSGAASLHEWGEPGADPAVTVRTADVPYTTRILLRRPRDAARFSGRVIVELLDATDQFDRAPLWGLSWEYFIRRGDAWVGVTVDTAAADALRRYDGVRYAPLNLARPADCASTASGQAWDLIAQVGALLRSSSKENPLLLLNPRRIVAAGWAGAGGMVTTYANALHATQRLGDGQPVFDGYLNAAGVQSPASLNPCAAPLSEDDARRAVLPRDVPFIAVSTESDVIAALGLRREDSDAPGDVFRLYEIAGASRAGPYPAGLPAATELSIAGRAAPADEACGEPRSDFPVGLALNAIWQQYEELQQQPMAREPRIEVSGGRIVLDESGNARGGWRLPQIELPLATYRGSGAAPCALTGSMQKWDAAALKTHYRNRAEYLRRLTAAIDEAQRLRRITAEDAAALKLNSARIVPAF